MAVLAAVESDWLRVTMIVVSLLSLLASCGCSIGIYTAGRREREKTRREEAAERDRQAKDAAIAATIEKMEARLSDADENGKQLVQKLVEERIRAASHEVGNHVQGFVTTIDKLKSDAQRYAEDFRELNEADHEQKLSLATQLANLKDWMRQTFADKGDLKSIDDSVRKLETKVAVIAAAGRKPNP